MSGSTLRSAEAVKLSRSCPNFPRVWRLIMNKLLPSKHRWLRWIFLFLGATVLAIVLSHALKRSPPLSYSDAASTPAAILENLSSGQEEISSTSDAIATPLQVETKYDRSLAHYATVSRNDGSFRQMFVESNAIATIQREEPLPDGTLIVMETWYSPENLGTVFVKQKHNGEWQYGSFSPDRPDYQMSFSGSCHSCHAPFPDTDFTLTKPLLKAALQTRRVQAAYCDRAGRTPCDPEVYHPNAS